MLLSHRARILSAARCSVGRSFHYLELLAATDWDGPARSLSRSLKLARSAAQLAKKEGAQFAKPMQASQRQAI